MGLLYHLFNLSSSFKFPPFNFAIQFYSLTIPPSTGVRLLTKTRINDFVLNIARTPLYGLVQYTRTQLHSSFYVCHAHSTTVVPIPTINCLICISFSTAPGISTIHSAGCIKVTDLGFCK